MSSSSFEEVATLIGSQGVRRTPQAQERYEALAEVFAQHKLNSISPDLVAMLNRMFAFSEGPGQLAEQLLTLMRTAIMKASDGDGLTDEECNAFYLPFELVEIALYADKLAGRKEFVKAEPAMN